MRFRFSILLTIAPLPASLPWSHSAILSVCWSLPLESSLSWKAFFLCGLGLKDLVRETK